MMDNDASRPFDAVKTPAGWVYALRPNDRTTEVWILIFFGLLPLGAGVLLLGVGVSRFMRTGWSSEATQTFLLVSAGLLAWGTCLSTMIVTRACGRDEIRLDPGAIRRIWRLGLLSWTTRVSASKVAQFVVVRRGRTVSHDGFVSEAFHALVVQDGRGRRRTLLDNYPRETFLALADALSSRWKDLSIDPDFMDVAPGKIAVTEDSEVATDVRDRPKPPEGTRLKLERVGKGAVQITKPAKRIASPSGIAWLGLSVAGASCTIVALGFANFRLAEVDWVTVGSCAFFTLFFIVGGKRCLGCNFIVSATADYVSVTKKGLFRTSSKRWPARKITSIRAESRYRPDGQNDSRPMTYVLVSTDYSRGPEFHVTSADAHAIVVLLRKRGWERSSEFAVVASRTGPGPIADPGPIGEGYYEYAVRQKTRTGGVGPLHRVTKLFVNREDDVLLAEFDDSVTKPELEWVATTLRAVLGVPDHDVPRENLVEEQA